MEKSENLEDLRSLGKRLVNEMNNTEESTETDESRLISKTQIEFLSDCAKIPIIPVQPSEEVGNSEIPQHEHMSNTDVIIEETKSVDCVHEINRRERMEKGENLEDFGSFGKRLVNEMNYTEQTAKVNEGSVVSKTQIEFVSDYAKIPIIPVQPSEERGNWEIPHQEHNTDVKIKETARMNNVFENNIRGINREASKELEFSETGLSTALLEAKESFNRTQEDFHSQDQFSSLSTEMAKKSINTELPTEVPGKDIYEEITSLFLSPIYPSTSEHSCPSNVNSLCDTPISKVRVANSKEVHFGPRINYVTKVTQATTSSEMDTYEILKKSDDAVLLSSSKLRLWYSTENAYMPSLVCYERSHDFSIGDCYLTLRVDEYNNSGYLKRSGIELKDMFVSDRRDMPATRILLTGNPGCGKTSTLKKLCFDWSTLNSQNNYLSHFNIVLLINLATLHDRTVEEMILDALFENRVEERREYLHKTKLRFLILLDSFEDLVTSQPVIDFLRASQSCDFSANMTIVVASRLHCIVPIRRYFQRHFHIEGFSQEDQEKYIDFRFSTSASLKEEFKSKLKQHAPLSAISKHPLMLHMLCCLHEENKLHGYTYIYREIFCCFIRRYHQKCGRSSRALKRGKYFIGENLLVRFGGIALLYLNKEICCIKHTTLKQEFPNQDEYEFITQLGFLLLFQDLHCQRCYSFQAIHNIFLEYVAAIYLTENPQEFQRIMAVTPYKFEVSNIIIFFMDMYDDKNTLLSVVEPKFINQMIYFDDCYRIVREIRNPDPFLETLFCCYLETSAENISTLLSYNKTKELNIHFDYSEYLTDVETVLSSIMGCSSLRKLRIGKSLPIKIFPAVDNWCVTWFVDMLDEIENLKDIINIQMKVEFTITILPKLFVGGIETDGWRYNELNTVPYETLPKHEHLGDSMSNCYNCVVAYQHELNIPCDGMTFVLPLHGYYIFDSKYRKLVIFRVPEKYHALFKESGIFVEIIEGILSYNIDVEIW